MPALPIRNMDNGLGIRIVGNPTAALLSAGFKELVGGEAFGGSGFGFGGLFFAVFG